MLTSMPVSDALSLRATEKLPLRSHCLDPTEALPPELYTHILWLACQIDFWTDIRTIPDECSPEWLFTAPLSSPLTLCTVSRRWRAIFQSTGSLWATIYMVLQDRLPRLVAQRSLLKRWISRSAPHPLTIIFVFDFDDAEILTSSEEGDDGVSKMMDSMYQDLRGCSHRWMFIKADLTKKSAQLFNEDPVQAQLLQGASFRLLRVRREEHPISFTTPKTETVLELELIGSLGIPNRLLMGRSENLTKLTFIYSSLQLFLDAMTNAPNLTHCNILLPPGFLYPEYFPSPSPSRVIMKVLKSLTIYEPCWEGYTCILDHLLLPELDLFQMTSPPTSFTDYSYMGEYLNDTQCVKLRRITLHNFPSQLSSVDFTLFPQLEDIEVHICANWNYIDFATDLLRPWIYTPDGLRVDRADVKLPSLRRFVVNGQLSFNVSPQATTELMEILEWRSFNFNESSTVTTPLGEVARARLKHFVVMHEGRGIDHLYFSTAADQMRARLVDRGVSVIFESSEKNVPSDLFRSTRLCELDIFAEYYRCSRNYL